MLLVTVLLQVGYFPFNGLLTAQGSVSRRRAKLEMIDRRDRVQILRRAGSPQSIFERHPGPV